MDASGLPRYPVALELKSKLKFPDSRNAIPNHKIETMVKTNIRIRINFPTMDLLALKPLLKL